MNGHRATDLPAQTEATAVTPAHPYLSFASRAALGLIVIALLLWHYDARPVLRTLTRERVAYFLAAVAIYVAGQVLSSWRWQLLAALVNLHARWREFLAYYFVGMFTNLFVPGLVGGDAARAVYLGRRTGRTGAAIASVLADRASGLIGLFWLAAAMAVALRQAIPISVTRPAIAVGIIAALGFAGAPMIALAVTLLPRFLRRAVEPIMPYLNHPVSTIPAILLSIVLHVSLAILQ